MEVSSRMTNNQAVFASRHFSRGFLTSGAILLVILVVTCLDHFDVRERARRDTDTTLEGGEYEGERNCTVRGIESFPDGVFTKRERLHGALVVNFLISAYMCVAIAYICAIYFVPSLEILSQRLNLQPDVAGATFMAAGSSAPEFFTAVIGTFISKDDTGVGAIVGSAAFNIFVITAICCFFAGEIVYLTWWPFFRDISVYVISVILLSAFVWDARVEWWEGLILALGYPFYLLILFFNESLSEYAEDTIEEWKGKKCCCRRPHGDEVAIVKDTTPDKGPFMSGHNSYGAAKTEYDQSGDIQEDYIKRAEVTARQRSDSHRTEPPQESALKPPAGILWIFLWVACLPIIVAFACTIPDCRMPGWRRKLYLLTFILSTIWLALCAYVLYWMLTVIGYTLDIPDTVMGITVLAAGTSVPDTVASMLVARDGYGDMAISNIFGSNVFEVFVCLGLLWFIAGLVDGPVIIASDGIAFTTVALILTVLFISLIIRLNDWKLSTRTGVFCIVAYSGFITVSILNELGILGMVDPPTYCEGPP